MRLLLRFAYNLLRLLTWPVWGPLRLLRRNRARWVGVHIHGGVHELPHARGPWLQRLVARLRPRAVTVHELRKLRETLVADARVEGLVLSIDGLHGGWATVQSLERELAQLKSAGKQVVLVFPQGASQKELMLVACADRVVTTPPAGFTVLGLAASRPYLTGLLSKVGLHVQVFARGTYKTAAESVARETMSEPEREQLSALLSTFQQEWSRTLASRSKLTPEGQAALLEAGLFGAEQAKALHVVDSVLYGDELDASLGLEPPQEPTPHLRYLARAKRRPVWLPLRPTPRVVIVRLEGAIAASSAAAGRGIALAPTRALLRGLSRDANVAGVLLFIDSPGGSAVVSDLLHREVKRLAAAKPVVAWCGNAAASGGYYLAVGAPHIVARPTSILGSIGVISAHLVATRLFETLGIRPEVVKLSPLADLHTPRELASHEVALIQAETERVYGRFLEVVGEGRRRPVQTIEPLAGGRVWAGADAYRHGLIDTLGGYAEARAALDGMLAAQGRKAAPDPLIVQPSLGATLGEGAAALLNVGASPAWGELRAVLTGHEPALTYAWDLPEI